MRGNEEKYQIEAEKLEILSRGRGGILRGCLDGMSYKETIDYYRRINKCTCGGTPKVDEIEIMGDSEITISCQSCGRKLVFTMYDFDKENHLNWRENCLKKWNEGFTDKEYKQIKDEEWERKRLHEEDLTWLPAYPNNMPCNGEEGIYCLIFRNTEYGKIYGCKWTIEYQRKEIQPMTISWDSPIEAYILHKKVYIGIEGPLHYPEPNNKGGNGVYGDDITLNFGDVSDYGDFVRAYKTLEEAKQGALDRCGIQGLNRETMIKI